MNFLADIMDRFSPGGIGWAVLGILGSLFAFVLVMSAISGWRNNFSRKPTVDDDFRSHQKVLDDLKTSLSGLAPNEKVNELVKQLGGFATQAQVREIEKQLPELITRIELERCMVKLEVEHDQQIKDLRAYIHEEVHHMRGDMQAAALSSDTYRIGVHSRLNALVEVIFEVRGTLTALSGRIEALSEWERDRRK